ncbi:alpha/beta hydrolase [Salinarchaeum laminariae]|uniref:alpha/beta hydrolase n=1 Tax=Salinarchaeum laminariae TaxID=869888 RepID=UPI0020BE215F|nr:alpha/beta hydrolase [Salinarchaeum laminariae]
MTAREEFGDAVDVDWDVRYRETPERDLRLDYYRPDSDPAAGLLFIHGGGWQGGDRDQFARQAAALSTAGYACATIDYRLSDEATYPAAVADVAAAVDWLYDRGIDRVAVLGGSAGGHLAALVALAPDIVDAAPVDAMVLFNPVLDMAPDGHNPIRDGCQAFLGTDSQTDPELYERASPISYVGAEADREPTTPGSEPPPALVCHGTDDDIAPFESSERFCAAIQESGGRADLFAAPGAEHAYFNTTPWYELTFSETAGFLQAVCPP